MTAEEITNKLNLLVTELDWYLNSDIIDYGRKDPKGKIARAIERLSERLNRFKNKKIK